MPRALPAMLIAISLLTSNQPNPNLTRANSAFQAGHWQAAVDAYNAAQAEGIDDASLHFRLGFALHSLGRIEEALPHHLRGSRINVAPIRIDCLYNAACAHALLSHPDDAIAFLQRAIDTGFLDRAQATSDPDLDSLRHDQRFIDLIDGIGVVPTLSHQLDFLLGTWNLQLPGGPVRPYTFQRSVPGSSAIFYSTTLPAGTSWAGSIIPDAAARTWTWTSCDALGTTLQYTGTATTNSVVWVGHQLDATGQGPHTRLTQTLQPDGTLLERSESSTDGQTWRTHHETFLAPAAASMP